MTDEEFYEWFKERVEVFAPLGIMHPKSEWGKIVKICLVVCKELQKDQSKQITSPPPAKQKRTKEKPPISNGWSVGKSSKK